MRKRSGLCRSLPLFPVRFRWRRSLGHVLGFCFVRFDLLVILLKRDNKGDEGVTLLKRGRGNVRD